MSFTRFIYRLLKYTVLFVYVSCRYLFQKKGIFFDTVNQYTELFVTHSFGGGTKQFENQYLKNKFTIILRNVPGFKTNFICIEDCVSKSKRYIRANEKDLTLFFSTVRTAEITVNSLVSFTNCFAMQDAIIRHITQNGTFLRYMVHDYHTICPNYTLICDNVYCDLHCIKNTTDTVIPYCSLNIHTIKQWREHWDVFLSAVNEIRVFSRSSMELMMRSYPKLTEELFQVIPHDMSYCTFTPYTYNAAKKGRIAFIGNCNTPAKGKQIIHDFITESPEFEIVFLGRYSIPLSQRLKKNLIFHGSYSVNKLQKLIEQYNIAVVIIPSICPETFSYLVSELIKMNIPLICFNLGAQAEKVKAYKNGYIAKNIAVESLKDALKKNELL